MASGYPRWDNGSVVAVCNSCDAVSRFLPVWLGGYCAEFERDEGRDTIKTVLLKCAGCGRGGFAVLMVDSLNGVDRLVDFYPWSIDRALVPVDVPEDLLNELREAEAAASIGACRAATALLRSALEKALKANGYTSGNLAEKIDAAAGDHVITEARKRQVHDDVRRLGNDIVHEDWRPGNVDEFVRAHEYLVWILEDFYADRPTVIAELKNAGRVDANGQPVS